ncbi:hypothetical protein [Levilactobacillus acidifarinae]|uniref:Uncharacterized protein n=1 Tax=Levilactobacillus acidifarinae DSM 19394 = JCM 15949 TaxID=1423715 RepID=A0A0R1LTM0_9LACO|nr:hypothetical protein [Levilactobacillus acidifarinae]KRK96548.1 hypothetical protein FD25_GL002045 [Levilactobacillus acidifarinae DSM 19394]GEO70460.1 hypothetical protein LAC03_23700 [Levilactobacillus acidifarinae]
MKYKELARIAEQNGLKTRVTPNAIMVINQDSDLKALIDRNDPDHYTIWSSGSWANFVPAELAQAIAEYSHTLWGKRDEPDYDLDLWKGKREDK